MRELIQTTRFRRDLRRAGRRGRNSERLQEVLDRLVASQSIEPMADLRLRPGLYDDASPALHFDVQAVTIEQKHAHERSAARRIGLDVSRFAIPEHSHVVNIEIHLRVIGQQCLAHVGEGLPTVATLVDFRVFRLLMVTSRFLPIGLIPLVCRAYLR